MIKIYSELNNLEKSLVSDFINRKNESKESLDEIDKMFSNK